MYKGLNKYYYSININYKTNELEQKMLLNLYKNKWNNALKLNDQEETTE
jgi:26S proteasome regulatory subunit N11